MEEKVRVESRKEKLGEQGLKRLKEKLAAAQAENDKPVPEGFLEQFKVPNPSSIKFIKTTTARSGATKKMGDLENPVQDIIDRDGSQLPLFLHFENIESNFVLLKIVLG